MAGRRPRTPETNEAAAHATASSLSGGQLLRRRRSAAHLRQYAAGGA
ncbi:hypothetical protein HMPREF1522_0994 [Actinomyces sp. ICM54]|nr:hypothetical protein HMPREF1522_0994 [Actinomyces sp. ICM54]